MPACYLVEDGRVLQGVWIESRPVRPYVDAFVIGIRLNAKHDSGIGSSLSDRQVDFDNTVLELDVRALDAAAATVSGSTVSVLKAGEIEVVKNTEPIE